MIHRFKKLFIGSFFVVSFLFNVSSLYAEDVNLSTYYPSPYGSYKKLQIEEASSPTISIFRQGVTQAGLQIISTYTVNNYTPGIFWTTSNDNPNLPKAGIWMRERTDASSLFFGTSNDYGFGINTNNAMVLDQSGNLAVGIGVGTMDPDNRLYVVGVNDVTSNAIFMPGANTAAAGVPSIRVGIGTPAPNEQLEITGSLRLPPTDIPGGIPTGVIYSGANRFIHNYGNNNFFAGENAGNFNISGGRNVGVGCGVFELTNSAQYNCAFGHQALRSLDSTTSPYNTGNVAVGALALTNHVSGNNNIAVGFGALGAGGTSTRQCVSNVAIGSNAMSRLAGTNNVAVGSNAGTVDNTSNVYTSSGCVFIGYDARPTVGSLSNAGAIGYQAEVSANNSLVLGGIGANAVSVGIGTATPTRTLHVVGRAGKTVGGSLWDNLSDGRLKQNIQPIGGALDKMLLLRGVTFEWKNPAKIGDRSGQHMGMIAQEVEKVFPEWVKKDGDGMKWLSPEGLLPLAIESIRGLHEENEVMKKELRQLREEISQLKSKSPA